MKNTLLNLFVILVVIAPIRLLAVKFEKDQHIDAGEYTLVIKAYDWGPGVHKVVLSMDEEVSETKAANFSVSVIRSAEGAAMSAAEASGDRTVVYAYLSDENGNRITMGNHVTLVLMAMLHW